MHPCHVYKTETDVADGIKEVQWDDSIWASGKTFAAEKKDVSKQFSSKTKSVQWKTPVRFKGVELGICDERGKIIMKNIGLHQKYWED